MKGKDKREWPGNDKEHQVQRMKMKGIKGKLNYVNENEVNKLKEN